MTKEFNLSDWILDEEDGYYIARAQVAEFIKRLKKQAYPSALITHIECKTLMKLIDKLAGEKLTGKGK